MVAYEYESMQEFKYEKMPVCKNAYRYLYNIKYAPLSSYFLMPTLLRNKVVYGWVLNKCLSEAHQA